MFSKEMGEPAPLRVHCFRKASMVLCYKCFKIRKALPCLVIVCHSAKKVSRLIELKKECLLKNMVARTCTGPCFYMCLFCLRQGLHGRRMSIDYLIKQRRWMMAVSRELDFKVNVE